MGGLIYPGFGVDYFMFVLFLDVITTESSSFQAFNHWVEGIHHR